MHRTPHRPHLSPGDPRPPGRFPSPTSCWGFPGARSPYRGQRGGSSQGYRPYSPGSPAFSPGSNRGFRGGSPGGHRGFGDSSAPYGGWQMRRRGEGFRPHHSFSPSSPHNFQSKSSDSVEKYFSPSMLQDPWAALQPDKQLDNSNNEQQQQPPL